MPAMPAKPPPRPGTHVVAVYFPREASKRHSKFTVIPLSICMPSCNCLLWRKTSAPPWSGVRKPQPFSGNQLLTLPDNVMPCGNSVPLEGPRGAPPPPPPPLSAVVAAARPSAAQAATFEVEAAATDPPQPTRPVPDVELPPRPDLPRKASKPRPKAPRATAKSPLATARSPSPFSAEALARRLEAFSSLASALALSCAALPSSSSHASAASRASSPNAELKEAAAPCTGASLLLLLFADCPSLASTAGAAAAATADAAAALAEAAAAAATVAAADAAATAAAAAAAATAAAAGVAAVEAAGTEAAAGTTFPAPAPQAGPPLSGTSAGRVTDQPNLMMPGSVQDAM
mmetsp:Transcript_20378/g.65714  ORF Transcript_20378/g.65714 Transcript_20378/m.65714 type:complete len:346 (-) Transcript_20378:13-1050(-)